MVLPNLSFNANQEDIEALEEFIYYIRKVWIVNTAGVEKPYPFHMMVRDMTNDIVDEIERRI